MCFGACPNEVWYAPDASASSIFVPFFASALSGADGKPSALHWSSSQFHIEFSSVAKMCSKCQSMSEHSGTEIDWSECVCVCVGALSFCSKKGSPAQDVKCVFHDGSVSDCSCLSFQSLPRFDVAAYGTGSMKSFSFASKDEISPAWWAHEPCMPTYVVVACGCVVFLVVCDGVVGFGVW